MPLFGKSSSPNRQWLAIAPHGARLDLVVIERQRDKMPRVTRCESYPTDSGMGSALARLRLGGKLDGRCALMLADGQYQLQTIEAPVLPVSAPPEELREAVRWKIKDAVDFPVAAAGIGVLPIPSQAGRPAQLFALVASHAVLKPYIEDFQNAKLELAAITVPEIAQRNLAQLFEVADRALALLSFNSQGGLLTLTCNGELYASRRIEFTADELARDKGLYERVVLDIQRSLDNFDRNFSHLSLQRLLVLPVPAADDLISHLRDNLYQPVEALVISDGLDISAAPMLANAATLADAWLALGVALEGAVHDAYAANLFDSGLQQQHDPWTARNLGIGLAASVLLCGIWAAWANWQQNQVAQEMLTTEPQLLAARDEVKQLAQKISGYQPNADLQQELEQGRLRLQTRGDVLALLKKGLSSETGNPSDWLRGFARQIPNGLWLTGFSINPDSGALEIHGRTADPKLVAEYVRRLNAESTFKGRTFAALEIKIPTPDVAPATPNASATTTAVAAPVPTTSMPISKPESTRYHEFALSSTPTDKASANGGRS